MSKITRCMIDPDWIESFEVYCEENNVYYEIELSDDGHIYRSDGLHVLMNIDDYMQWIATIPQEDDCL